MANSQDTNERLAREELRGEIRFGGRCERHLRPKPCPECAKPARQEQEPVANVVIREGHPTLLLDRDIKPTDQRLYTAPQREWVGLTEEECIACIDEDFDFALDNGNVSNTSVIRYARAIEAKLREKNK